MARLAGVDLPNNKRVEYALPYIYGIGLHSSRLILDEAGIDHSIRTQNLTEDQIRNIRQILEKKYTVEGDLRKEISLNIKRLMDLGSYKGIRHRRHLPVRGQKTKTNARTRKGPKKIIVKKK